MVDRPPPGMATLGGHQSDDDLIRAVIADYERKLRMTDEELRATGNFPKAYFHDSRQAGMPTGGGTYHSGPRISPGAFRYGIGMVNYGTTKEDAARGDYRSGAWARTAKYDQGYNYRPGGPGAPPAQGEWYDGMDPWEARAFEQEFDRARAAGYRNNAARQPYGPGPSMPAGREHINPYTGRPNDPTPPPPPARDPGVQNTVAALALALSMLG